MLKVNGWAKGLYGQYASSKGAFFRELNVQSVNNSVRIVSMRKEAQNLP